MKVEGKKMSECDDCPANIVCQCSEEVVQGSASCKSAIRNIQNAIEAHMEDKCEDCENINPDVLGTEDISEMFKNLSHPEKEIAVMLLRGDLSLEKLIKEIGYDHCYEISRKIIAQDR